MTATMLATGTYTFEPTRSAVRFRTNHGLGLGPVAGTFALRDGTISVDADLARSRATARIDAASFTTDKPRRDADIRSKRFLHADAHPDLVFTSDRLAEEPDGWRLYGTLTVRGTSAPVVVELASTVADPDFPGSVRFQATARVDRHAYRVGPRGFLARYVDVEFDLLAIPTG
jgi:polyisoprenoid-binding protein YceI